MGKLKVFEAFSGIGSQSMALRNIGIPYEVVAISEIDKYAIKVYETLHGKVNNLGDISKIKVEDVPEHDLFTYSFPCQSISTGGKRDGFKKDSNTKSSLLWECERVIEYCKPKYLLMENVKNILSKKFKDDFDLWLRWLDGQGYNSYYSILDAKEFGVPQHRERVFVVSVKKEFDVGFEFYNPGIHKDLSEFVTDDFEELVHHKIMNSCQTTFKEEYENIICSEKDIYQCKCDSGFQDKKVGIRVSPTLRANKAHTCVLINNKIKRLDARDMWMLSGFKSQDFDMVKDVVSESQLMKQAGNTIVVPVLEGIFKTLLKDYR